MTLRQEPVTIKYSELSEGDLSDSEIFQICRNPPDAQILQNTFGGSIVLQLNDHLVVKYGGGISIAEANNQHEASKLLDPSLVRVPKVYRYMIDDESRGYILMQYMEGVSLSRQEIGPRIHEITQIVQYLSSFVNDKPGPLDGSAPRGVLFEASPSPPAFQSISHMNEWWNTRVLKGPKIEISGFTAVLCHMDIVPRNIIWKQDEPPALLDWDFAGFYPYFFEDCSYRVRGLYDDCQFGETLSFSLRRPENLEDEHIIPILRAWDNMQRFSFRRYEPGYVKEEPKPKTISKTDRHVYHIPPPPTPPPSPPPPAIPLVDKEGLVLGFWALGQDVI